MQAARRGANVLPRRAAPQMSRRLDGCRAV